MLSRRREPDVMVRSLGKAHAIKLDEELRSRGIGARLIIRWMPPGHRCDPIPPACGRDSISIHGDAERVERLDHAERSAPGDHDRDGRRGAEGDVRVHVHVRRGLVAPHNGGQGAQRLPSLGHEVGLGVLVIDARRNFPHRELDIELPRSPPKKGHKSAFGCRFFLKSRFSRPAQFRHTRLWPWVPLSPAQPTITITVTITIAQPSPVT